MAALITTLIDKVDNVELIRDEIAAILLIETEQQKQLAGLAGKDPARWDLRIFSECTNPWAEFEDAPRTAAPIVNVTLDSATYDIGKSDLVQRQYAVATYHLDCYGYGCSSEEIDGHSSGDQMAALEAQRAVRLVRNILMSSVYVSLGHPGLVAKRWPSSVEIFQPQIDSRPVQHVVGARMAFEVHMNEFSPQYVMQPLEAISLAVYRGNTGEILFTAEFSH